jgi:hypothetical protein
MALAVVEAPEAQGLEVQQEERLVDQEEAGQEAG